MPFQGLANLIQIEIREPDQLLHEVKNLAARHFTPTARNMIFTGLSESQINLPPKQIDLSRFVSVKLSDTAKKGLTVAAVLAALFFIGGKND